MFVVCINRLTETLPYDDVYQYKTVHDSKGVRLILRGALKTMKYTHIFVSSLYLNDVQEYVTQLGERVSVFTNEDELRAQIQQIFEADNAVTIGGGEIADIESILADYGSDLQDKLQASEKHVCELEGTIGLMEAQFKAALEQIAELTEERDMALMQMQTAVENRSEVEQESNINADEYADLANAYNEIQAKNEEIQAQYDTLIGEYNNALAGYEAQSKEITELRNKVREVTNNLENKILEYEQMNMQYINRGNELGAMQTRIVELEEIAQQYEALEIRYTKLQENFDNLSEMMKNMQGRIESDNTQNLEHENMELKAKQLELQGEVDRLEQEVKLGENKISALTAENNNLKNSGVESKEIQLKYNKLLEDKNNSEKELNNKILKLSREITELNTAKSNLEHRLSSAKGMVGTSILGKFDTFATNPTSINSELMSASEMQKLNGINLSNISVCAFLGDGLIQFCTDLSTKMDTFRRQALFVDLCNNGSLVALVPKDKRGAIAAGCTALLEPNPSNMVQFGVKHMCFGTAKFNDLYLLTVDWGTYLRNLAQIANGAPVVIVLGNLSSFACKSTFVKLASVCKGYMITDGRPMALIDTLAEVKQLSSIVKFLVVAAKTTQSSDSIIKTIQSRASVKVMPAGINFEELGLV